MDKDNSVYDAILQGVRAATGVRRVHLTALDPVRRTEAVRLRVTPELEDNGHPSGLLEEIFGETRIPVWANAYLKAVYWEGQIVAVRLGDLSRGVVPRDKVVKAWAEGLRYSYAVPVMVRGMVAGALHFHHDSPLSPRQRGKIGPYVRWAQTVMARMMPGGQSSEVPGYLAIRAEERVRRQLAEELHGPIQTRLLLAWYQIEASRKEIAGTHPEAAARLAQAARDVDSVRENGICHISRRLHPTAIRLGLIPGLKSLVALYRSFLEVELDVDETIAGLDGILDSRIPEGIRLTVYRMVEECLNNVVRHAKSRRVAVLVRATGPGRDQVLVAVSDDGIGMDPAKTTDGLGLLAMAYRIEEMGGHFRIHTALGTGTRVIAVLPLGVYVPGPANAKKRRLAGS